MSGALVAVTWTEDIVRRSAGPGENALRYLELLSRADLLPVLVGPGTDVGVLDRVDGLLLTGGPDIEPQRYGAAADPRLEVTDPALDALELELVAGAVRRGMPVLGICRGQQLINVALGGTLHQHIEHPQWDGDATAAIHDVRITPGTLLHRDLGADAVAVNSGHHQAIDRLAPGLLAAAHSPDGMVEAVESADGLLLGVQWHPEEMPESVASRRLADGFADRVKARRRQ